MRIRGSLALIMAANSMLFGIIGGVSARATTINFDDFSHGGSLPIAGDRYSTSGVLLSTDGLRIEVSGNFSDGSSDFTNTPPYWLSVADGFGDIIVDFVLPGTTTLGVTDSVSFYMADFLTGNGAPWTVSIFDLDDNLLDSITDTTNDEVLISFSRSEFDIHRVVIDSPEDDGIDTLTFGTIVPEPGTLALLVVGAATLGRRRGTTGKPVCPCHPTRVGRAPPDARDC